MKIYIFVANYVRMDSIADILKNEIMTLVDNINKHPEMVETLGRLVAKSKFDWSLMAAIIRGLKNKLLMDKTIQVMVDTWNEHVARRDDICYRNDGYHEEYRFDAQRPYKVEVPMMRTVKYLWLERDLKAVRDEELERREIDKDYQTLLQRNNNLRHRKREKSEKKLKEDWFTEGTFTYKADTTDEDNTRPIRQKVIVDDLILHFVKKNTNKDSELVLKLFTGKKLKKAQKIIWRGTKAELVYLFRNLNKKHYIIVPTDKDGNSIGLWNVVASHFSIETELKKGNTRQVAISPDSLQSDSQKLTNKDVQTKLDAIISLFAPELNDNIQSMLKAKGPDREESQFEELTIKDFIAGRDKDRNNLRGMAELTE